MYKPIFRKLLSYFLQGLILIAPIAATLYIVVALFQALDNTANSIFEIFTGIRIPGLGVVALLALLTLVGYLSSLFIVKPLFNQIDKLMDRTPGIKIIYSGIKDLISAFASTKKKFDKPVLISLQAQNTVQRMGFITQEDLTDFNLKDYVAVYVPHSYNFSGNLYVVAKHAVVPLSITSSEALKFIVSGGISDLD